METSEVNKNRDLANGHRYFFDDFEIDPSNRMLLRDGQPVPLTGKDFDILLIFAQNSGRLLEKDELLERVWQGSFVEEGNLARHVSTLRKALGDDPKNHKFITTVQGRGYRFIMPVREVEDISSAISADQEFALLPGPQALPTSGRRRALAAGALLLAAIAITFLVIWSGVLNRKPSAFSFERMELSRLPEKGTISPDGRFIAFLTEDNRLAVHQIATGSQLTLLPPSPGAHFWQTTFSPDCSVIYYTLAEPNSGLGVTYRIPTIGGNPTMLVEGVNGGPVVSADGKRLVFSRRDAATGETALITVNNDGTNPETVRSFAADVGLNSFDWAPDGQSLVYAIRERQVDREFWYVEQLFLRDGSTQRIGQPRNAGIRTVRWLPDKSGFIMNALDAATGLGQIWNLSYPDGIERRITNDINDYSNLSLTADARSIMANQLRSPRKIWILPDGDSRRAYQLKSQVGLDQHFETILWTPDGRLVYDSDEGGTYHIWRMRSDGSDQQRLTSGAAPDMFPALSPDGNTIVFVSRRSGTSQLWRIDIDGRNPVQLTNFEGDTWRPQFMPDGQTIIFDSFVGGKARLWRVSINGGEVSGVIDSDTGVWAISPDGGYLAFNYFDEQRHEHPLLLQPLAPNFKTRSVDIYPETKLEWTKSGRGIFYNWNNDNKQNIWRKTLDASPPEPVTNFHDSDMVFNFNHSANGKDLAVIRYNVLTDAVLFRFKD